MNRFAQLGCVVVLSFLGGCGGLTNAASSGDAPAVQALIDKGADVNAKNLAGTTPLIWASQNGHLDVVQLLLDKGADVNAKQNNDGATALMIASYFGHVDVAQALLAKGADVNAMANTGETALTGASANGHPEVVQALIESGASSQVAVNGTSPAFAPGVGFAQPLPYGETAMGIQSDLNQAAVQNQINNRWDAAVMNRMR
ncbi:MAG: ankyrin repeat domain-containing protein [Candidatus Binataceae bacterium]